VYLHQGSTTLHRGGADDKLSRADDRAPTDEDFTVTDITTDSSAHVSDDGGLAAAYAFLQLVVGCIAIALPFVLVIGGLAFGDGLQSSMSAYYYTPMSGVFVGSLSALGVFFLSYQHQPVGDGYKRDNIVSNIAAAAAIGVALFPTAEHSAKAGTTEWWVSTVHLSCACVLFVTLAIFSLVLFKKTNPHGTMTPEKRRRNRVYEVCGSVIVAVMGLVIVTNIVHVPDSWNALLYLEAIGVVAFGISWLVKSGVTGLLSDSPTGGAAESGRAM
jgi:hypothetical protein